MFDPIWLAILAPLIVAGIGALFKLAMRGLDRHMDEQDRTLGDHTRKFEKQEERMNTLEVRLGEIRGMLVRKGLDERAPPGTRRGSQLED